MDKKCRTRREGERERERREVERDQRSYSVIRRIAAAYLVSRKGRVSLVAH